MSPEAESWATVLCFMLFSLNRRVILQCLISVVRGLVIHQGNVTVAISLKCPLLSFCSGLEICLVNKVIMPRFSRGCRRYSHGPTQRVASLIAAYGASIKRPVSPRKSRLAHEHLPLSWVFALPCCPPPVRPDFQRQHTLMKDIAGLRREQKSPPCLRLV